MIVQVKFILPQRYKHKTQAGNSERPHGHLSQPHPKYKKLQAWFDIFISIKKPAAIPIFLLQTVILYRSKENANFSRNWFTISLSEV